MNQQNMRLALVIGASTGFGAAIAAQLRREGFGVVGTSRRAVPNTPIDLQSDTLQCVDVCDEKSVQALKSHLLKHHFNPDVIILNAGFGISGPVEETPTELAEAQFATNFFGLHRVVHAFLPKMRQRGSGQLIFIGSIARQLPLPFQTFYTASKAALAAYSDALRMEVMVYGINVSNIEPGDHQTEFASSRAFTTEATNGAYQPQAARALVLYETGEKSGAPASKLATLVARVAMTSKPEKTYRSCIAKERIALALQVILPAALFERVMMFTFKIPRAKP
jgi:short-subunit dehydrogenase